MTKNAGIVYVTKLLQRLVILNRGKNLLDFFGNFMQSHCARYPGRTDCNTIILLQPFGEFCKKLLSRD